MEKEPREPTRPLAADAEPAIRDAEAIGAGVAEDEAAAERERELIRVAGLATIDPDEDIASVVRPAELVFASTRAIVEGNDDFEQFTSTSAGRLIVTDLRVLLVGPTGSFDTRLDDIEEIAVIGERRLFLALRGGSELRLEVSAPRVLRVRLAEAMVRARAGRPG